MISIEGFLLRMCGEQQRDTIPSGYGVSLLFRSRLFTEKGIGKALSVCQESDHE